MGVITDGQLSYGVVFGEDFEFPWDSEEFGGDIEGWWRALNGYVNPNVCPFTDAGEYKPGYNGASPEVDAFFGHVDEWDKQHPLPVELVNYCSSEVPMWIVAVKHARSRRGYPCEVAPSFLADTGGLDDILRKFFARSGIEPADEAKWWLSSYWG